MKMKSSSKTDDINVNNKHCLLYTNQIAYVQRHCFTPDTPLKMIGQMSFTLNMYDMTEENDI